MRLRIVKCLSYALIMAFSAVPLDLSAQSPLQIEALALFPGQAVLRINGQQKQLRAGEETIEGVRLVSSGSKEAVVEYQGQRRRINLSSSISTQFSVPTMKRVVIAPDARRHFYTTGSINSLPVKFMVDTGATSIAMSSDQATRLGISFRMHGDPGYAQTAAGVVPMYSVKLDRVQVGEIEVQNVEGSVIEGAYPSEILLGMSFLRHVKMQEVDGTLHLIRNY